MHKEGAKIKNKDNKMIGKSRRLLQRFFSELQRDRTLRSSEITYYFLSLNEKVQFEKRIKEINKWPAPKKIAEIKHFDGKAKIEVTPSSRHCRTIFLRLFQKWTSFTPSF